MNTLFSYLLIAFLLVACSSAPQETPPTIPEPTDTPQPTATATEPVETVPPPPPTETHTPQPTPTEIPTLPPPTLQVEFTAYENNPILLRGANGEWDYFGASGARVVLIDDTFHLFYVGWDEGTNGIGYAVSTDGLTFTKHDVNPIFQPDGEGFDAAAVRLPTPLMAGDNWMLYYNASTAGEDPDFSRVGSTIGLTTAPDPTGPWSQGQSVLQAGGPGEWDSGFIVPNSVIATDEGYRMYYTGGTNPDRMYIFDPDNVGSGAMCGMATSMDGINWIKYDDPSTTETPYAESDPVLQPSPSGWDEKDVKCSVFKTDTGYEMIYQGLATITLGAAAEKFGYASSVDGVNWEKFSENPIIYSTSDPPSRDEFIGAPSALKDGNTYYLYFSYLGSQMQGVFTGTISQR